MVPTWLKKFLTGPASIWDLFSSYLAQSSYLVRNNNLAILPSILPAFYLISFPVWKFHSQGDWIDRADVAQRLKWTQTMIQEWPVLVLVIDQETQTDNKLIK